MTEVTEEIADHPGQDGAGPRPQRTRAWAFAAALLPLFTCLALHLPWIDAPFGPGTNNAGTFLGVYARHWERHGFAEMRGLPVSSFGLTQAGRGIAYFNHPPLPFWLAGTGPEEWRVRLPSVVAHAILVLLITGVVQRASRRSLAAVLAGLAAAVAPCAVFWVGASFELLVSATGLTLLIVAQRALRKPSWLAWTLVAACAFVGVWMDWSFAFFCVGLWPLAVGRKALKPALRVAASAAVGTALALGSWWAWVQWAKAGPLAPAGAGLAAFEDRAHKTLGLPEDWSLWAQEVGTRFIEGHGLPFLMVGAAGLLIALLRQPRLVIGLLTASALQVLIAAEHAMGHIHFTSFAVIPLSLGFGWLATGPRALARVGLIVGFIGVVLAGVKAVECQEAGSHPIFRDLGLTLDEASANFAPDGSLQRVFDVAFNLPYTYRSYQESPFTIPAQSTPAALRTHMETERQNGLRVLVLEWEIHPQNKTHRLRPNHPPLIAALEARGAPFVEIPRLVTTVRFSAGGFEVRVQRARLYTLIP